MTPLTASQIVSRLAIAESRQVVGILADFNDRERAVARGLLERVGADARIDPVVFAQDVRTRARDEAIREAARRPPGAAWRYGLGLMTTAQLGEFKRLVESGTAPDDAAIKAVQSIRLLSSPTSTHAYDDAEPDEDLDEDDAPAPKRRRGVPRRRLNRLHRGEPAVDERPKPLFAGPRILRSGADDFDLYYQPSFRPPWLLDDLGDGDEEEEPDEEEID